ncbi:MAG: sugar transferase, partial [bacterium]|nr:sugar transferase [bacterium]
FVGPRPLLVEYLPLYNEFQNRRHEVRPGLTGLSQIKIRNAGTWEDKFFFDVSYIDNQSFLLDLKIIMITVKKVIKREGITDSQGISAEKFRGNDRK